MFRKIFFILLILCIAAVGIYSYAYRDARNISTEDPEFTLTAKALVQEYGTDAVRANGKYLNKTIEITGNATEVSDSAIVLDKVAFCGFDHKPAGVAGMLSIKGRCIGYDELFNEVKLDQCTVTE